MQRINDYGLRGTIGSETTASTIVAAKPRKPAPSPSSSRTAATPAALAGSKGADTLETRAAETRSRLAGLNVRVFLATTRDAVGDGAAEGTYVYPGGEINVGRRACSVSVKTRRAERLNNAADANGAILAPGPRAPKARRSSELSPEERRQLVDAVAPLGPKFATAARAARTRGDVREISDALNHAARLKEASEMGQQSARDAAPRRGEISPGYARYMRESADAGVWLG